MKQPLALRIEPDLLEAVRRCAADENRSLTNFIETVLKARIAGTSHAGRRAANVALEPDTVSPGGRDD